MTLTPPASFTNTNFLNSEVAPINLNAISPIVYNSTTQTVGIQTASGTSSGAISLIAQTLGAGVKNFSSLPQCAIAPVASSDLANKGYVDTALQGISWQQEINSFYDFTGGDPPGLATGNRYIATVSFGLFVQWDIYQYNGSAYVQTTPQEGYACYVVDDTSVLFPNQSVVFNGTTWVGLGTSLVHSTLVGLATGDDHTQYWTVSGRAGQIFTLRNNDGTPKTGTISLAASTGIMVFDRYDNVGYYFTGSTTGGQATFACTTASTSPTTGALLVGGGAGINDTLSVGTELRLFDITAPKTAYTRMWHDGTNSYFSCSAASRILDISSNFSTVKVNSTDEAGAGPIGSIQTLGGVYAAKRVYATDMTCLNAPVNPTDVARLTDIPGTSSTPQFARLGIGVAADGTIPLTISGTGQQIKLINGAINGGIFCNTAGNTGMNIWAPSGPLRLNVNAGGTSTGSVVILDTSAAISTSTGSLITYGGIGAAGGIFAGGDTRFTSATVSSSVSTGAVVVTGGFATGATSYMTAPVHVRSTGTGTEMGVDYLTPGASNASRWVGFNLGVANSGNNVGQWLWNYAASGSASNYMEFAIYGTNHIMDIYTTKVAIGPNTTSTSTTTGALTVVGGAGFGENVWIGGDLHFAGTVNGAALVTEANTELNPLGYWTPFTNNSPQTLRASKVANTVTLTAIDDSTSDAFSGAGGPAYFNVGFSGARSVYRPVHAQNFVLLLYINGAYVKGILVIGADGVISLYKDNLVPFATSDILIVPAFSVSWITI